METARHAASPTALSDSFARLRRGVVLGCGRAADTPPAAYLALLVLSCALASLAQAAPVPYATIVRDEQGRWVQRERDGGQHSGAWPSWWGTTGAWILYLPLWIPAASVSAIALLLWRRAWLVRRSDVEYSCPTCGYSMAGIKEGAACPECGALSGAARPVG